MSKKSSKSVPTDNRAGRPGPVRVALPLPPAPRQNQDGQFIVIDPKQPKRPAPSKRVDPVVAALAGKVVKK